MRIPLLAVTVFFLTLHLAAATNVRLGPEVPLTPAPELGPAAFGQTSPAVASNGRGFVAVWYDEREQASNGVYTTALTGHLYATALDADGHPREPFGHRLANSDLGSGRIQLASNGDDYLVKWSADGVQYLQRLDENGFPAAEAQRNDAGFLYNLLSNGSTYLAITSRPQGLFAVSLDRDGAFLGEAALGLDDYPSFVSAEDGHYVVVGSPFGCNTTCGTRLLLTIDDHAGTLTVTKTKLPVAGASNAVIVITPERLLFATPVMNGPYDFTDEVALTMYDRANGALASQERLKVLTPMSAFGALWDGKEFLVTTLRYPGLLNVTRVRPQGSVVPGQPIRLSDTARSVPVLATNGTTRLLIWGDGRFGGFDLMRRTVHELAELATPPETVEVFQSRRAQPEVAVAATAAHVASAWRDDTGHEIHAAIDGREILVDRQPVRLVGKPSVAAAGDRFLVAWYDAADVLAETASLFVRRYSIDGTPVDATPVRIVPETRSYTLSHAPGITADGTGFIVADASSAGIVLLRLEGEGDAIVPVSHTNCPAVGDLCWGAFPPMRIGGQWVVPYIRFYGLFSPHTSPTWTVDVLGPAQVTGDELTVLHTGIASDGERVTVAKPQLNGIAILQSTPPGAMEQRGFLFEKEGALGASLVWTGSEYLLAWMKPGGGPIRAIRLGRDGQPLDEAFEIAPNGSTRSSPSLVVRDGGVIIAYSRSDPKTAGVPRAYMRTLGAFSSTARRQAVRH